MVGFVCVHVAIGVWEVMGMSKEINTGTWLEVRFGDVSMCATVANIGGIMNQSRLYTL